MLRITADERQWPEVLGWVGVSSEVVLDPSTGNLVAKTTSGQEHGDGGLRPLVDISWLTRVLGRPPGPTESIRGPRMELAALAEHSALEAAPLLQPGAQRYEVQIHEIGIVTRWGVVEDDEVVWHRSIEHPRLLSA